MPRHFVFHCCKGVFSLDWLVCMKAVGFNCLSLVGDPGFGLGGFLACVGPVVSLWCLFTCFPGPVSGDWRLDLGPHSNLGSGFPARFLFCGAGLPSDDSPIVHFAGVSETMVSGLAVDTDLLTVSQQTSQSVCCVPGLMLAPYGDMGHSRVAISTCQEAVGHGHLGHQARRAEIQVLALGSPSMFLRLSIPSKE